MMSGWYSNTGICFLVLLTETSFYSSSISPSIVVFYHHIPDGRLTGFVFCFARVHPQNILVRVFFYSPSISPSIVVFYHHIPDGRLTGFVFCLQGKVDALVLKPLGHTSTPRGMLMRWYISHSLTHFYL